MLQLVAAGVGHAAKSSVVMQQTTAPCWSLPLAVGVVGGVMVLVWLLLDAKALGGGQQLPMAPPMQLTHAAWNAPNLQGNGFSGLVVDKWGGASCWFSKASAVAGAAPSWA